jgi:translation initiation factor 2B subunit (eIF-2B alpha/beta/delta family)
MTNVAGKLAFGMVLVLSGVAGECRAADVRPIEDFGRRATWSPAKFAEVRSSVTQWLASRELDVASQEQVEALWNSDPEAQSNDALLDLVVTTIALVEPKAQALVDRCAAPRDTVQLPDVAWLAEEGTAPIVRDNLRLLYGRWLVQQRLYDEALGQLQSLQPDDVVDPAALLFYQAVVHHRMLDREPGLAAIARLLENEDSLPKRYASVARLMQADLEGLKDESLDHIARRMDDIRRRLDLGRAGQKVREVEDGVIASLDKLIEEIEKQQQQAAAAAARAGGQPGQQPMMPLPDSRPMELKAPGDVANKPVGNKDGWGELPPHERQEALQQIGKEFPAHYRDMIEQYFRKLANDGAEQPQK